MSGELGKWEYWIKLYVGTHCTARGLAATSIIAYQETLRRFRAYADQHWSGRDPDRVTARDVLEYVEHLRRDLRNGDSAVNRAVTILRNFYRAMVAMKHLDPRDNPMAHFPRVKQPARRLPETLTEEEVPRLLAHPKDDTVIGVRDRAILTLLYATGIRVSECAGIDEKDVDLERRTVRVRGKGGHDRTLPLNETAVKVLAAYKLARGGKSERTGPFFISRKARRMGRSTIYDVVRRHALGARLEKHVSPHRLRHAFATHLVRAGVNLVTIRDLLGHRQITSTQIYLHMTALDLRKAADLHPVSALVDTVKDLLPNVKLPFQNAHAQRSG
jgi:site-specific recombinase XerD